MLVRRGVRSHISARVRHASAGLAGEPRSGLRGRGPPARLRRRAGRAERVGAELVPGVAQRLLGRGPLHGVEREHVAAELRGEGGPVEGWAAEVDPLVPQALLDALHCGTAHPVLAWEVVKDVRPRGELARQQLVHYDADAVDVRGGRVLPRVRLGGDVAVRAEDVARLGAGGLPVLHRVEVDELHLRRAVDALLAERLPALRRFHVHHHVLQLEVLVDAAGSVHRPQGLEDLPQDLPRVHLPDVLLAHVLEEVLAANLLHDHVVVVLCLDDLHELADGFDLGHVELHLRGAAPLALLRAALEGLPLFPHFDHHLAVVSKAGGVDHRHARVCGLHDLTAQPEELREVCLRHELDALPPGARPGALGLDGQALLHALSDGLHG
mmetsp:Transcript_53974/g.167277  ORF Transcript_53974/g.167277 Transcript_53974/m.167277 type:complete len:382 (+) Transcript_53974:90-1235(+)